MAHDAAVTSRERAGGRAGARREVSLARKRGAADHPPADSMGQVSRSRFIRWVRDPVPACCGRMKTAGASRGDQIWFDRLTAPYRRALSRDRYAMVSTTDTTSAYFAFRSNRLWSWAGLARSPTASRTTMGRKPYCTASTAVARTHPLVVERAMMTVSSRRALRRETRSVPKKAEAYFLTMMGSSARRPSRGSNSTAGVPALSVLAPFHCFLTQTPPSRRSFSSYQTVV